MIKKAKQYPNPRFSSLEKEDEYWKTHSPLDEGYEGEVQKSKQKRSSFLSIRLTGDELTKLRDMAAKFGIGPSTYVRLLLKLTSEQEHSGTHYHPFLSSPNLIKYLRDSCDSPADFQKQIEKFLKGLNAYIDTQKELLKAYEAYQENKQKVEQA